MSLKRISKQASRLLADHSKVRMIVHIHIQHLVLPENIGEFFENGTSISVCFERGGKMSSSTNKVFDLSEHDPASIDRQIYTIDETVELVATLYQDNKTKTFQEKKGKLILREAKLSGIDEPKQRESRRAITYRRLGAQSIDLAQLAPTIGQTRTSEQLLPIELSPSSAGNDGTVVSLKASVTTCFFRKDKMGDDVMSLLSDDDDDMVSLSSDMGHSMGVGNTGYNVNSSNWSLSQDTVLVGEKDHTTTTDGDEEDPTGPASPVSEQEGLALEAPEQAGASTSSEGGNSTEFYDQLSPYSDAARPRSPNTEDPLSARSRQSAGRCLTRVRVNKEAFQLHIAEIESQKAKIESLEKELADKEEHHKTQLLQLHTEKNLLQTNLDREKTLRKANAAVADNADAGKLLQKSREETNDYASKFGRASAELHVMKEEMEYCRMLAEKAGTDRDDMSQAARQAADVAVQANVRRAELEAESSELLEELITIKIAYAETRAEFDKEHKKSSNLRARVEEYAEIHTRLEMKYLQALSMALPCKGGVQNSTSPLTLESGKPRPLSVRLNESSKGIRVEDIYAGLIDDDYEEIEAQMDSQIRCEQEAMQKGLSFSNENPSREASRRGSRVPSRSPSFTASNGVNVDTETMTPVVGFRIDGHQRSPSFTMKPVFDGSEAKPNPLANARRPSLAERPAVPN